MWFDVQAELEALGEAQIQRPPPANPANLERNPKQEVPQLAGIAAQPPSNAESLLSAIEASREPQSKWQARAGALSSHTRLGATITYQLIDRLLAQGRIVQSKDGVLRLAYNCGG